MRTEESYKGLSRLGGTGSQNKVEVVPLHLQADCSLSSKSARS